MSTKPTWDKRSSGDGSKYRGYAYALSDTWDDNCPDCEQIEDRHFHTFYAEDDGERTIESLPVGSSAYTVPWSMSVDDERQCWLRADYTAHTHRGGTACMRIMRYADGFDVDLSDLFEGVSWNTSERRPGDIPVHTILGGADRYNLRPASEKTHSPGRRVSREHGHQHLPEPSPEPIRSLVGVEQHLSLDFKRKAKDKDWPVVEMTRAVADALDQEGQDATWEKLRQHLVPTAPEGTLEGGTPAHLPAPGAGYWLLSAIRAVVIVGLFLIGGLGLIYLSDEAMQAALNHFLEKVPFARETSAGILRGKVVELAAGWGIPESVVPYTAMAPLWAMAVPAPKRPAPPPVVPDNYWKELVEAVRTNRTGAPAATSSSTPAEKDSSVPIAFPREFYNKPTLFRVTGVQQLRSKYGDGAPDTELPTVDFIVLDHATGTFEQRRDITLRPSRLSKRLVDVFTAGARLTTGYPVLKPTPKGNEVLQLVPMLNTDQDNARLHHAAAEQFAWWAGDAPAAVSAREVGWAGGATDDPQRKIADAKAALASLDEQWLDFTTATTPDGLRAYYFEMPALWRRPAAPAVTEYESALFDLRELLDALPATAAAEDADRASRAAERALTAWSDAQQYAISIGIDDGRSVEEAAAARQLPKLLAQFLDPSTGAAQATRLRTIIEQQMRKLTTRPAAEHMDAVNAGALHLHRAPVLAAIER